MLIHGAEIEKVDFGRPLCTQDLIVEYVVSRIDNGEDFKDITFESIAKHFGRNSRTIRQVYFSSKEVLRQAMVEHYKDKPIPESLLQEKTLKPCSKELIVEYVASRIDNGEDFKDITFESIAKHFGRAGRSAIRVSYFSSREELRQALVEYYQKKDKPIPESLGQVIITRNQLPLCTKELIVEYVASRIDNGEDFNDISFASIAKHFGRSKASVRNNYLHSKEELRQAMVEHYQKKEKPIPKCLLSGIPSSVLGIDTNNHTGQKQAEPRNNEPHKIKAKESNISAAMRLLGMRRFRKQRLNISNPDGLNTKDITKKNEYEYVDNEGNEAALLENLVAVATSKLNKYLNKRTDLNKPKESKPSKQYSADQTEEHGFNNKMRSIKSAEKDLQELLNILAPEDKDILEKAYQEAVAEIANTNQGTTEWQKTLEYYSLCKSIKITYDKNIHNAYKAIFRKYSSYYKIIHEIFIAVNTNKLTREDLYLLNSIKVNLLPIIKNIEYNSHKYQAFCKKYNISPEKSFAKAARTILISMAKLSPETNELMQLIVQEVEALVGTNQN